MFTRVDARQHLGRLGEKGRGAHFGMCVLAVSATKYVDNYNLAA